MEPETNTPPPSPPPPLTIRPAISALILRGNVELDEISTLDPEPNKLESTALIPALSNTALAMRIHRSVANTPNWPSSTPGYRVKSWMYEVCRRLENEPAQIPQYSNVAVGVALQNALATYPKPTNPATAQNQVEALWFLATTAAIRLQGGV